jgi:dihydrofolate reductase
MRKIISGLFISLDGVVEEPQTWHFPYFSDEMGAAVGAQMAEADTMLLGRRTYQAFASSWGHRSSDMDFTDTINAMPKLVASTTMFDAPWRNTTLLKGDLVTELTRIKEGPGGTITVPGSIGLVRSLLQHGLLDELKLMIHPIVVGAGQRLFDERSGRHPLTLVRSEPLPHGVLYATYAPAAA